MTTALLITARMTSERLPGKPVMDICGQQALALMLRRLKGSADYIVVCAPDDGTSEPIEHAIPPGTATLFLGHPTDLLARLAGAAKYVRATEVVMTGADCPLTEPGVVRVALKAVAATLHANVQTRGWPIGLNVQAVTTWPLYEADAEAVDPDERIYYNAFFDRRPDRFPLVTVTRPGADEYAHRVTLDTAADLALIRQIVGELGPGCTGEEIIAWLHANPDADRTTRGGYNYHPDTSTLMAVPA
jgi:spore coat polysaccharide biosynthesis protein SpsF